MKIFKKLIKDKQGGSIEVLIAVVLLMFIFFSGLDPVIKLWKVQVLEDAKMKALDAMQQQGGLTANIESAVVNYLVNAGFDEDNITVNGTIAEVQWGDNISIEITYTDTTNEYNRNGLLSFGRSTEEITYTAEGSTTSYYYNNN